MSDGLWRTLNGWIHGTSSFIAFACDVAILVAIATIVRRHRPDAYRGLQAWAIASLGAFLFTTVAWMVLPFLARPSDGSGLEGYFRMSGLLTILGTVLHVVLVILLIRGLTARPTVDAVTFHVLKHMKH